MTSPRLRTELDAHPAEEQGIKFFDVSDPRSGSTMRLYDFEWLLVAQMDGRRSLEEIARWAKGALHLDVTQQQLEEFTRKLDELAFFDAAAAALESEPEVPGEEVPLDMEELPTTQQPSLRAAGGFNEDADTTVRAASLPPAPAQSVHDAVTREAPVVPPRPTPAPIAHPVAPPPVMPAREEPAPTVELEPAKRSGSGSIVGLLIVLLVVAAVVVYVMFFAPSPAKVSIAVAKPGAVVRTFDGVAKLETAPPRSMSFGEPGKVVDVVAAGTEVKAGQALATLDGYTKVEKDLADVKDRLGYYQKQAEAANAKNDAAAAKTATDKVEEKKKLLAELEARAAKLRLVAPGPGVVEKVLVKAGDDAKPGEPAIELTDKRQVAVFKLPADAALKAGDDVSLETAAGATVDGKVASVEGGNATVEVADGASVTGDLKLVKSKLNGAVTLPASAVVKKNGADVVYTLADGAVHEKKVTVADRSAASAYVTSGLSGGESVVTSGVDKLQDGQKAVAAQ